MPKKRKKTLLSYIKKGRYFLLGAFILALDQLSKYCTQSFIPRMSHENQWYPYNGIGVFPNFLGIEFSIVHTVNKGAAWGILADFQDAILLLRAAFVIGFFIYILFFNKNKSYVIPFVLILAGALGNILDYFIYSHVVDMFHFVLWGWDYPVFNVADASIFVGICYVIALSWFGQPNKRASKC